MSNGGRYSYYRSWTFAASLMQTELAKLSIFLSFAGYLVIFSDAFFEGGYPNFPGLGLEKVDPGNAQTFMVSSVTKWRLIYFGLLSLMVGRLFFNFKCPTRLREHGFTKSGYIQSIKRTLLRSDCDAMFDRVKPDQNDPEVYMFEMKKQELYEILFPDFNAWARALWKHNTETAWQQDHKTNWTEEEAAPVQTAQLQNFLTDSLSKDFDMAICENPIPRFGTFAFGLLGYSLLTIPALDLLLSVIRAIAC